MDAIPTDLTSAAQAAKSRLAGYSYDVAAAGASGAPVSAAMSGAARAAIFTDALLGAMHARLEELKGVTK